MYRKTSELYLQGDKNLTMLPFRREPPKQRRAVISSPEKIREVLAVIKSEDPTFAATEKNVEAIFQWLWENEAEGGFTLPNVRVAVKLLEGQLERVVPAPPPAPVEAPSPPPIDYWALSDQDELPLDTPEWRLRTATKAQLHSFLKRAEAERKKK
jgi:hypothetical protein